MWIKNRPRFGFTANASGFPHNAWSELPTGRLIWLFPYQKINGNVEKIGNLP